MPAYQGSKPHVPTAAQQTQLATLKATAATANVTLASAVTSHKNAQASAIAANKAVTDYEAYIYGGAGSRADSTGIIDDGGAGNTV